MIDEPPVRPTLSSNEGSGSSRDQGIGHVVAAYVLLVGVGAAALLVVNFPASGADGPAAASTSPWLFIARAPLDQRLLLLATFSGITGSFIHAAQSLGSYLGNRSFRASWTAWYLLRPWIGGVLGMAIYAAVRAGIVPTGTPPSTYGVVALGLLGGWFSKTTTDKLQEVFETLFRTDQDAKRKNKVDERGGGGPAGD